MRHYLLLFTVVMTITLAACSGSGGGSSVEKDPDEQTDNGSGSGSDSGGDSGSSGGTGGINSGGTGSGGTVKPSTVGPGGGSTQTPDDTNSGSNGGSSGGSNGGSNQGGTDHDQKFLTHLNSNEDWSYWACFAHNTENIFYMYLLQNEESNFGGFIANQADEWTPVGWQADANTLLIENDQARGTYSNYNFINPLRWDATFRTGDFEDDVSCALYDQDGNRIDAVQPTLAELLSNGEDGNDPDLNAWECQGEGINPYISIFVDSGLFSLAFSEDNVFRGTWAVNEENATLTLAFEDESTAEFTELNFSDPNNHTVVWQLFDPPRSASCRRVDQQGNPIN